MAKNVIELATDEAYGLHKLLAALVEENLSFDGLVIEFDEDSESAFSVTVLGLRE